MRCPVPARLYLRRARRGHAATWVIKDHPNVEISTGLRQSDRLGAEKALLSYLANKHWGQQKRTPALQPAAEPAPTKERPNPATSCGSPIVHPAGISMTSSDGVPAAITGGPPRIGRLTAGRRSFRLRHLGTLGAARPTPPRAPPSCARHVAWRYLSLLLLPQGTPAPAWIDTGIVVIVVAPEHVDRQLTWRSGHGDNLFHQ